MSHTPHVSVVIPTHERPQLVTRAVRSALAQTLTPLEVIVVVDGRDAATAQVLADIRDVRVRVVIPPHRLGNADARNLGIGLARAGWIALLDDDDLWMPGKLAAQLTTAEESAHRYPIITCRMIGRNELEDFLWPRRYPHPGEPLCEYLFCRSTPFTGEGMVQTSTILTHKELLERVPFVSGMRRYVDLDWILRAAATEGVGVEFVPTPEPLSVWHMEAARQRISNSTDGEYTLHWAREHRHLFTRRAYAAFLLTMVSMNAASGYEFGRFVPLLREAYRDGEPSPAEIAAHLAYFAVPDGLKRLAAAGFTRLARSRVPRKQHAKGFGHPSGGSR
jgi:glycosyltransferase involved in cell wall biosynthesis